MRLRSLYQELLYRNRLLTFVGVGHIVLFIVFLVLSFFDGRLVMGINPWIKPMKFALSVAIYVWTIGWFLSYLLAYSRSVKIITWGVAITMVVEIICIIVQATRGVPSHFNFSTPFDALIFAVMGNAIAVNTLLIIWMTGLFFFGKTTLSSPYLFSVRFALLLFLFASAVGGMMVGQNAHSVGVTDGGAGLPFVNWSTEGGDLRIAHFFGIHSLQIIPFFAFLTEKKHWRYSYIWTWGFALGYLGLTVFLFWEATDARPLLSTLFR